MREIYQIQPLIENDDLKVLAFCLVTGMLDRNQDTNA